MALCCCAPHAMAQLIADFEINKPQGCVPLSGVNFTDISSGAGVVSRTWDLGNGTIINNGGSSVGTNYLADGDFRVRLTVVFSGGEIRSAEKTVTVHPRPIADFSAAETQGCAPFQAEFSNLSSTKTGNITEHLWNFGGGGSTQADPSFHFTSEGDYNVSLLVKNSWGCESQAVTKPAYIKVFPKAVASFTVNDRSSCSVPFTTTFTNTSAGEGSLDYTWDFGNGMSSKEENPSVTYTEPGVFRVQLTVSNGPGCSSSFSTGSNTDVYAGTPEAVIQAPAMACANAPVSFNALVDPSIFGSNFKWTFHDNGTVRSGRSPNYTFANPGTYKIELTVTNQVGCAFTTEHEITINPAPAANFAADRTSNCSFPFTVNFSPTPSNPGLRYEWNFGDGTRSSEPSPSHTYTRTGNFTVRLEVTDESLANGCTAVETKSSYIRIQRPSSDFTYSPPAGCLPLPVRFVARASSPGDPIVAYEWDFGDGNTVTVNTQEYTHTYRSAGNFQAKLTVVTSGGCRETSMEKPVSVALLCDDDGSGGGGGGGGGGFTVGKSCSDKYLVRFEDTEEDNTVLSWDFGDGSPVFTGSPINPVTHRFPETKKEYVVTVTRRHNTTGEQTSSQKRVIIIDEKADFVPDLTSICAGKTVSFSPVGIDPANIHTYTWDFGDGSPQTNILNQQYFQQYGSYLSGATSCTYNENGIFRVKLTVRDKLGCESTFEFPEPIVVAGPRAVFSASENTSCDPEFDISYTDESVPNGNTPIAQWEWSFGDGGTANATDGGIQTHTYQNEYYYRSYTVQLKVVDEIGCESQTSQTVKSYRPKAEFESRDTLTCGKMTISFSNRSSAYNAAYSWDFGDESEKTTGYAPTHTYEKDGNYSVKLVTTDENGCKDSTTKASYIKLVRPVADFTIADSSKCAPVALILGDGSEYASSYTWDFGDGGTGTRDKDPAPHIYAVPGFYDISLHITGVGGCESSITKKVRVKGPIGQLIEGTASGCAPFTSDLRVEGSNISTYSWDMGDGTPVYPSETDFSVQHEYPSAGRFVPNVVLSSPEGCQYTLKATEPIVVDDAKALYDLDKYEHCDTGVVAFTNLSTFPFGNQGSFIWNFGDGETSTEENPAPHPYEKSGTYAISLIAESWLQCRDTFTITRPVTVFASPTLQINGASEQCAEEDAVFEADIVSEDQVTIYNWFVDDVPFATNQALKRYFELAGTYDLALAVQTRYGCMDTLHKNFTVHALPDPQAAPDTTICTGDAANLRAHDGIAYEWLPASTIDNSSSAHPTVTPTSATTYTVRVENEHGCVQYDSVLVRVDARVGLMAGNDAIICLGERTRLSASGNATHFTWSPPEGLSNPGITRPWASPTQTTTYVVTGHSGNVCPGETASTTVTVGSIPTVNLGPDHEVQAGTQMVLSPQVSQDVVSWQWRPFTGLDCNQCPQARFTADKSITYSLLVKTQYGCEASDDINIRVLCGKEAVYIPNAFTPNGDGHNDVFFIKGYGIRTVRRLQIFSRWGDVVYNAANLSPNDPSRGWDGRVNGTTPGASATFAYIAEVECHEGGTIILKGSVTLVR